MKAACHVTQSFPADTAFDVGMSNEYYACWSYARHH